MIFAPTIAIPVGGSLVDRSGTTTGGVQTLMNANSARVGWWIQNQSSSASIWIFELSAPSSVGSPGFQLLQNTYWVAPTNGVYQGTIFIIGATSGISFSAREW